MMVPLSLTRNKDYLFLSFMFFFFLLNFFNLFKSFSTRNDGYPPVRRSLVITRLDIFHRFSYSLKSLSLISIEYKYSQASSLPGMHIQSDFCLCAFYRISSTLAISILSEYGSCSLQSMFGYCMWNTDIVCRKEFSTFFSYQSLDLNIVMLIGCYNSHYGS